MRCCYTRRHENHEGIAVTQAAVIGGLLDHRFMVDLADHVPPPTPEIHGMQPSQSGEIFPGEGAHGLWSGESGEGKILAWALTRITRKNASVAAN